MKSLRKVILIIIVSLALYNLGEAQQTARTTTKKARIFPQVTISPFGGVLFPVGVLGETFKPGGNLGLDLGYRVNKEVGFYGKFGYYFMTSKLSGAPVGSYLEFSGGPRYFFTKPNLKSSLYLEGGVGGYSFNQSSYVNPEDTIAISQISDTRAGINAGIGANLALSDAVDILIKTKYNVVFTPGGSNSFVTVGAGLEFKIK